MIYCSLKYSFKISLNFLKFKFFECRSSKANVILLIKSFHLASLQRVNVEWEKSNSSISSLRRPHLAISHPPGKWQKEHQALGQQPPLCCSVPRWLWSLILSRPGIRSLCECFLAVVNDQVHSRSHPAMIMLHRCKATDAQYYLHKSLEPPIPSL